MVFSKKTIKVVCVRTVKENDLFSLPLQFWNLQLGYSFILWWTPGDSKNFCHGKALKHRPEIPVSKWAGSPRATWVTPQLPGHWKLFKTHMWGISRVFVLFCFSVLHGVRLQSPTHPRCVILRITERIIETLYKSQAAAGEDVGIKSYEALEANTGTAWTELSFQAGQVKAGRRLVPLLPLKTNKQKNLNIGEEHPDISFLIPSFRKGFL